MEVKIKIPDDAFYLLKRKSNLSVAESIIANGEPLEPFKGKYIEDYIESWGTFGFRCSVCHKPVTAEERAAECYNCKAKMEGWQS